jgi:hypothetical protein
MYRTSLSSFTHSVSSIGIPQPASPLVSQLTIGLCLLLLSILTFLLGMVIGHRHWAVKHPPDKYSSDAIYTPMVSNTGITEPVADLDMSSWCTNSTSPIHLYGVGVSSGRNSQLAVVMEVPDGDNYADIIPSPQGNEEEVESRHYGNIVHHHESLKRPMKSRNVGLKKHPTDSDIGDRRKALSCDNLCDQEEAAPQIAKSQSLEILGKPLKAQQSQQQPVEEQLYEDVDIVMPRRDLPASGTQLKYDYISTSLVDWRGSMETLSNQERKAAKGCKVILGKRAAMMRKFRTPQDLSASFTEWKEQSESEEDAPLLHGIQQRIRDI